METIKIQFKSNAHKQAFRASSFQARVITDAILLWPIEVKPTIEGSDWFINESKTFSVSQKEIDTLFDIV